jgi:hypothetical protein
LLLHHHPATWLTEESQGCFNGEIARPGRFAAHLFGHLHEAVLQVVSQNGAEPWRTLQGNSLFGFEILGDGTIERRHGYAAGRIEVEGNTAYLRIWPRKAERRAMGYWSLVPDYSLFELEEDQGTRPDRISFSLRQ